MGVYSQGKEAIQHEQEKQQQAIMRSVIPLNIALETTKRMVEETTLSLTKLKAQSESLKAIGDITTQFIAFNIELQQLKDSQKELIGLLKAVLTESYRDAETQKRIEALLI